MSGLVVAPSLYLTEREQNHEVAVALQNQHHRVRYSDCVEPGSIIFSLSGVAFLLVNTQDLSLMQKGFVFDKVETFIGIHRNSFLLLVAALHGREEWRFMFHIQQRFLGSNLRVIPVHNTADTIKVMLTIAKGKFPVRNQFKSLWTVVDTLANCRKSSMLRLNAHCASTDVGNVPSK
ncbi:protein SPO16 homolog [Pleurodeles waltl]|uniref:protein SPO16 homolog n=1 Tax=Pleurodeles waltl TaxID=8319 RepID=UPI0037094A13